MHDHVQSTRRISGSVSASTLSRMRLKISLHPNWAQVPDTLQFRKKGVASDNALQVSTAESKERVATHWNEEQLAHFAQGWVERLNGQLTKLVGGTCEFGKLGSAIFHTEQFPFCQVWVLSDGINFINVTHLCTKIPSAEELVEADYIVSHLGLNEER